MRSSYLVRACSGFTWRVSDWEELLGLLAGNEDCLQRLTERTFYGVSTLSGLSIRKIRKVIVVPERLVNIVCG